MENMAEALKIAFAVMMFVLALTLSMSSFSQATRAVNAITSARDAEWIADLNNDGNYYNDGYYKYNMYVTPSENLTRTVGIETVVTSIYRAYEENMIIYFFENDGTTPLGLYNEVDNNDNATGNVVSFIDESYETFGTNNSPKEFLDIILGGDEVLNDKVESTRNRYRNKILYSNGLYDEFKNFEFEEKLGEYEDSTGLTKRVITYIKK